MTLTPLIYHGTRAVWRSGNSLVISLPPGSSSSYDVYEGESGVYLLIPHVNTTDIIEVP